MECKGFSEAKPELLKHVLVWSGGGVRVAEEGACFVLFPLYGGKRDYAVWCRGARGVRVHPGRVRSVAAESEHLSRSFAVKEHAGHGAKAAVAVHCERYKDVPFRQEFANDGITVSFITISPQFPPLKTLVMRSGVGQYCCDNTNRVVRGRG